ncbi:MAG: glucosaminidase domain-containing protein [Sedimentisphaerales bacterium]|nr:glucosaminidase domain-containing protein [Sedimentisphaerales bacterium]
MKDLRAVRKLILYISLMVVLVTISCQSPGPQPMLHEVKYDKPYGSIPIAAIGRAQVHHLISFFTETNPRIDMNHLKKIASTYIDEAAAEGINSDVAFCQMVHETNYLRFDGDVQAWQNNFGGIGATGKGERGESFPSIEIGIRAHIQHLKAYANARPLRKKLVDPRFGRVRRAQAPYVEYLTGLWATDPQYGLKLKRKLKALEKYL